MTELSPSFKKIAKQAGMEFAPIQGLDSYYFKLNGIGKRVLNSELDEWTADDFRTFAAGFEPSDKTKLVYVGMQPTSRYHSRPYYVEVTK